MQNFNPNIVYISVFAGAGGDDAKDWAKMLLKMYGSYAERNGWKKQLIDDNVFEIQGNDVYANLKDESGVHRLIRISPFDSKQLRHTSFALIEVLPDLPDIEASKLVIPDSDLKFEFYRSSGPGGQNVNKVETAVRVIHLPTGLKACSQIGRSQQANREQALKLLKAKLIQVMEEKKEKELSALRVKVAPEWAHEIRTYVLHPYKMVKDHRTGKKISQVERVLNGELDLLRKERKKDMMRLVKG